MSQLIFNTHFQSDEYCWHFENDCIDFDDDEDHWLDAECELQNGEDLLKPLNEMLSQEDVFGKVDAKISVSKVELLLGLLTFALHYSLSNKAIQNLFESFNILLDRKILPDTLYFINKFFTCGEALEYYVVCPKCKIFRKKFNQTLKFAHCEKCN